MFVFPAKVSLVGGRNTMNWEVLFSFDALIPLFMASVVVFMYVVLPIASMYYVALFGVLLSQGNLGKAILFAIIGFLSACLWAFLDSLVGPSGLPFLGRVAIVGYILVVIVIVVVNLCTLNKTPNRG